jgi:hypothetical protein
MLREHIGNLIWGTGGIDLHFIYTPDIMGEKKIKKSPNALGCSMTLQWGVPKTSSLPSPPSWVGAYFRDTPLNAALPDS